MAAVSLAILGKTNEPLYLREFLYGGRLSLSEEELFGLTVVDHQGVVDETPCSLRQQFILHAALDRFEQLSGPPPGYAWRKPGVQGTDAMFVGLLCPVENMRVYGKRVWMFRCQCHSRVLCFLAYTCTNRKNVYRYVEGYMTTTQIRFLLAVQDHPSNAIESQPTIDDGIKMLLVELHRLYVEYTLNPFSALNAPIQSKRFDSQINNVVEAFNKTAS
jgi:hypothetical protein